MTDFFFLLTALLILPYLLRTAVDFVNWRHALAAELPKDFTGMVDAKKYADAQAYLAAQTRYQIASRTISLVATLAFLWLGGFSAIDQWARHFGLGPIATGLVYFLGLGALSEILSLPLGWYHTFVLEEKFGFNRSNFKTFVGDTLKSWILGLILGGALMAALFWFLLSTGTSAWIWAWAFMCVFQIVVAFLAPIVIMPLFNKFEPLPEGGLRSAIENYAKGVKFKLQGIFTMDGSKRSSKANAFFTGFGRFRRIVLFDTLVNKHPTNELVAVLAHEVGHFKRGHILKQIALSFAVFFGMFWLLSLVINNQAAMANAIGFAEPSLHASLTVALLLSTPLGLLVSLIFQILSRKYEFEADAFARETTGDGPALIEALKRLSVESLSNLNPHPWKVFLDYSHPPVTQRIAALRAKA
ncbi:MAG: M48 family metallopeptidase [Bdellovibrionota bacterium]